MIKIREISEQDLTRLADYLPTQSRFSQTTRETWERRFDIWWTSNPAFTHGFPRGWILEDDSSPVGFIGSVPVKFLICGVEKTAVAAVAWYVDPAVRGLSSIGLLNEFIKQPNASLYLFNTDKEDIMKLLSKMKFKKYVLPQFQTKYFLVLKRSEIVSILIRLGILKRVHDFKSLRYMLMEIGSFLRGHLNQKSPADLVVFPEKKFITSLCSFCDDSFSKIWESSVNHCDVTLSRNTETLNWIYFSPIKPSDRVVVQCRRVADDSLAGYMVFDLQRTTPSETAFMKLMDICIEGKDPDVLSSLLQAAAETGKKNNAAVLELWAPDTETETYLSSNFTIRRESSHHNLFRFSENGPLQESLTICPSMIAPPRGIDH